MTFMKGRLKICLFDLQILAMYLSKVQKGDTRCIQYS